MRYITLWTHKGTLPKYCLQSKQNSALVTAILVKHLMTVQTYALFTNALFEVKTWLTLDHYTVRGTTHHELFCVHHLRSFQIGTRCLKESSKYYHFFCWVYLSFFWTKLLRFCLEHRKQYFTKMKGKRG